MPRKPSSGPAPLTPTFEPISALDGLRFRETGFCNQRQNRRNGRQVQLSRLRRCANAPAPRQSGAIRPEPGNLSKGRNAWWARLYRDPVVAQVTRCCNWRIADLVDDQSPVTLYLVVPPSDISRTKCSSDSS